MSGKYKLSKSARKLNTRKADKLIKVPATLGIPASNLVEVEGRDGYHYARIRGNLSELVEAYNPVTTPVFDMPVLIIFRNNRWEVDEIDTGRYITWGQNSPTVPVHGDSHFISGFDPIFITTEQIVDSLVYALATGVSVYVNDGLINYQNNIGYIQGQSINLASYRPTGSGAIWAIVRSNVSGTISIQGDTTYRDNVGLLTYNNIPDIDAGYIPLAAVRLWYGQTSLNRTAQSSDIIDLRYLPSYVGPTTGTSTSDTDEKAKVSSNDTTAGYLNGKLVEGAGISLTELNNGGNETLRISYTGTSGGGGNSNLVIYDDNIFKITGTAISFNDGLKVHITGSVAYIDWTGTTGPQGEAGPPGDNTLLIYDDNVFKVTGTAIHFNDGLNVIVTGSVAFVDSTLDWYNVKDYGAVGDGIADDSSSIQLAINDADDVGGVVYFPAGKYRLTTGVALSDFTTMRGISYHPQEHLISYLPSTDYHLGSWIYVEDTTNPAITVGAGSGISGLSFYYPNQAAGSNPPTTYPPTIKLNSGYKVTRVTIRDCFFQNPYYAIDASTAHEMLTVENCQGYPLRYGIVLDISTDIDRIDKVHFNPNCWREGHDNTTTRAWVNANGFAFQVSNVDWTRITNSFAYGYRYGLYLLDSPSGAANDVLIQGCGFDNCRNGVFTTGSAQGIKIIDCDSVARDAYVAGSYQGFNLQSSGDAIISNCRVWGTMGHAIYIANGVNLIINNNLLIEYGSEADTINNKYGIYLGPGVNGAIVDNNQIDGNLEAYVIGIGVAGSSDIRNIFITNNRIKETGLYGIELIGSGPSHVIVKNNILRSTGNILDNLGSALKEIGPNLLEASKTSEVADDAIFVAKGDLIVGTSTGTAVRLPVGTNNYILTADSSQTTGVKWAAPSSAENLLIYDDSIFKVTGTAISFDSNLSVVVTGSVAFIAGQAGTPGSPGSNTILIYDDNTFKVTGTAIHFNSGLDVITTGSSVWVDSNASGTQVIAARYSTNAGQLITGSVVDILINFEDMTYDTHSAVSIGSNWKFTAPASRYYHVDACILFDTTNTFGAGEVVTLFIYVDGVKYSAIDRHTSEGNTNQYMEACGSDDVYLAAGSYLDIRVNQGSGGNLSLLNNGNNNHVAIHAI